MSTSNKLKVLTHEGNNLKGLIHKDNNSGKITVSKVSYVKSSGLESSKLILLFKNTTTTLVNTIRRVCLAYIPSYAFCSERIEIQDNTSIYDNDYMRLRLSQLTFPKLTIPISYLNDQFWLDVNYSDKNRDKHPDDTQIIEIYINSVNNTNDKLNITTNDADIFIDGERVEPFDKKYPNLLIQLRPKDVFRAHMTAQLGIGRVNDIWSASRNSYYAIEDNNIKFTLESAGQLDEFNILDKACMIIKRKVHDLKTIMSDKYGDIDGKELTLTLENEDHTLGNILNEYLQQNDDVVFSGMAKPDLLIQQIIIKLVTKKNVLHVVNDTIETIIDVMDNLQEQIKKLK